MRVAIITVQTNGSKARGMQEYLRQKCPSAKILRNPITMTLATPTRKKKSQNWGIIKKMIVLMIEYFPHILNNFVRRI